MPDSLLNPAPRRRCHPRTTLAATATLLTRTRASGAALVDDFSIGGVRVTCDLPVRRGQKVALLLDLPGWGAHTVDAEVCRHHRGPGGEHVIGLVFLALPPSLYASLEKMVADQLVANLPSIEFFDTERGGCQRMVLGEDPLVIADRQVRPI